MMKRIFTLTMMILATVASASAQGSTVYPGALDSAAQCPQAVDNKFTYLAAAATSGATTLTVGSTAGVPASGVLQIDSELMAYSTATGTTFTVTRGFSGTTAAAHASLATVRFPLTAAHVNCPRGAALALEAKLGTGASDADSASTGQQLTKQADGTTAWAAAGGGSGTVTSVALSAPSAVFDVSGSPVTTDGTLALAFDTQTANTVFAGPASGGASTPTFRALVEADVPVLSQSKITGLVSDLAGKLNTASNLADLASASTARTNLGLGTASVLNAPASGNAAAGEVVKGSDTRLTDSRAPTSHAHAAADVTSGTLDAARIPALSALSGAVTDAQVPNTITVDLATLATTAATANAGDSATAFFPSGTVEAARLGSGAAGSSTYLRGDQTWATPVTSVAGTAGQITASASTGALTLSLPTNVTLSGSSAVAGVTATTAGDAAGYRSVFGFNRARGTVGSPSVPQSNDYLGSFTFSGWDGAAYLSTALIDAYVDGAVSSGVVPARLSFVTSPNSEANRKERLIIDANGSVVVGSAALATTATAGFLYLPTAPGVPTGVPTAYAGRVATVYDTANNKLCIYSGAWRCVQF